jgi:RNA polymerase sigma-70 factor (ECF subfamily)
MPVGLFAFTTQPRCSMNELTNDRAFPLKHSLNSSAPASPLDEETELVQRAKNDPAAFGELYEAYYQPILNYLYRRTLSIAAAEELTSNTFFKALRGLPKFHPRASSRFRAWLYRIATNEAGMYWRSRKGRREMFLPSDENDLPRITFVWPETEPPERVREKQKQYALVHQALGHLPKRYQSALTLRYFEGLAHEEIAEILGKRVGTVKSLVHRGLTKLSKIMAKLGATE